MNQSLHLYTHSVNVLYCSRLFGLTIIQFSTIRMQIVGRVLNSVHLFWLYELATCWPCT